MVDALLKRANLRTTKPRVEILSVLLNQNHAIAQSEIELALSQSVDRVTIYRTLNTFQDKGLIHSVLDGSSQPKFAICHSNCSDHQHHDSHVHFKCESCAKTFCLEDVATPAIKLPNGFVMKESALLVEGLCEHCSN